MKNILSIDTVFGACAVGVIVGDRSIAQVEPMQRGQAERLMPMIIETLTQAGTTIQDLDLIVVNVGPGSFTGVRVGIATARGIALGLNIPVQGVCATDALYKMALANGIVSDSSMVRMTIDSQRGDFFVADYDRAADLPLAPDRIKILSDIQEGRGDRTVLSEDLVLWPGTGEPGGVPYPVALAQMGVHMYANGPQEMRARAEPMYLREADISMPKKGF